MTRDEILAKLGDDETVKFFEPPGMDVAIIGLSVYQPRRPRCVVYDYDALLAYFIGQGMSDEEAEEWVTFNTLGAWLGVTTPLVIVRA